MDPGRGAGPPAACGGAGLRVGPSVSWTPPYGAEMRGAGFCFSFIVENLKTLVLLQTRDGVLSSVIIYFRKRK